MATELCAIWPQALKDQTGGFRPLTRNCEYFTLSCPQYWLTLCFFLTVERKSVAVCGNQSFLCVAAVVTVATHAFLSHSYSRSHTDDNTRPPHALLYPHTFTHVPSNTWHHSHATPLPNTQSYGHTHVTLANESQREREWQSVWLRAEVSQTEERWRKRNWKFDWNWK